MSTTTSSTTPAATVSTATTIENEVVSTLIELIPALGPYGAAISLAFTVVSTVAPPVYAEIKSLIAQITAGGTPTPEQIAALQVLIGNLQTPDGYFNGTAATPAT